MPKSFFASDHSRRSGVLTIIIRVSFLITGTSNTQKLFSWFEQTKKTRKNSF